MNVKKITMWLILVIGQHTFAQSLTVIHIASPDLTTSTKHSGGGVVEILYTNHWIESEFSKDNIKL